jgi:bifunctional DNA-binding transcriptional regulator/antitoxin component of YhaV-PrlF toxin-antitoxin module
MQDPNYSSKKERSMGYKVKLQKIERPTNKTFSVTIPVVLVEAMELQKGEEFEWSVEDKNTMLLKRRNPLKVRRSVPGQG